MVKTGRTLDISYLCRKSIIVRHRCLYYPHWEQYHYARSAL